MTYLDKNRQPSRSAAGAARKKLLATAAVTLFVLSGAIVQAQTTNATLSGLVVDASGARVPGARVTLTNQQTKDVRTTVTNKSGAYSFSAVSTGTYNASFRGTGFGTITESDIELHPGDERSLPDIALRAGDSASITVMAADSIIDTGERSALISKEDIQHLAVEGRDATELLKTLPGFALQSGPNSNAGPDALGVGVAGNTGAYAANGSPEGGVGIISDGSNIQDPGAGGAGTQTINMDMVEEIKVQTSNFGAESAKGPIVINAVGKSGSANYHGSLYIIANTSQFNSQDWISNHFSLPKPRDRYLYPGFNIGGPVQIPGTSFNHNKKLVFFVGAEDYVQRNTFSGGNAASAVRISSVPTDRMRTGDFSPSALSEFFNAPLNAKQTGLIGCPSTPGTDGSLSTFGNTCAVPTGTDAKGVQINNGIIQNFDPGAAAILKIFPHPNRTPQPILGGNASDGLNRTDLYLFDNNLWQARGRLDYGFSEKTKLYGVYNIEQGHSYSPFTLYYNPSGSQGILEDPSLIVAATDSQTGSVNLTHVFSSNLTNELFAAGSFYYNPFGSQDQTKNTAAAVGYPYQGLVNTGTQQIPNIGYGTALPLYQGPDFSQGTIFARKVSFDGGDNVTFVYRDHTFKGGVYIERTANNQKTPFAATQGSLVEYGTYNGFNIIPPSVNQVVTSNPGNALASFLLGSVNNFSQQSSEPIEDMHFLTYDAYLTDSWKATKRLTLTYGVRFDHLGPWIDSRGAGLAVWNPAKYNYAGQPITIANLPGISWHALDNTIPLAGRPTRPVFVQPRVGFAYDVNGNGKTVVRGGWGEYRSHDSWNDYNGPLNASQGSYNVNVNNTTLRCVDAAGKGLLVPATPGNAGTLGTTTGSVGAYGDCANIGTFGTSLVNGLPALSAGNVGVSAILPTDDQQPDSYTYSMTISQQMPRSIFFEVGYAGSENAHLLNRGLTNINTIPAGALFGPDPNKFSTYYGQIASPDNLSQISDYRPFPFYNNLNVLQHNMHSNYNALQVSLNRRSGRILFGLNYTWSRTAGDLASGGGSVGDRTNERNDVGVFSYDRAHIANATYTFILGSPWHRNAIVGGFINGWEVSGITNLQSGPNVGAYSSNFNLATNAPVVMPGVVVNNTFPTDNKTYLGTPDISLQPITTCDPSAGLAKHQYVNGSCFALPQLGANGPFHYANVRGPGYFNSDISAQKSFKFGERKDVTLRAAGFNFLNHPLPSLTAANSTTQPLTLHLTNVATYDASTGFGVAQYKERRRVVEITLRVNF